MGNYLADRRIELGLTQKEVAEAVGVTEATVSRWESGTIANMRRDKINLLAKALHASPNFIMTGEGDPSPKPQTRGKIDIFSSLNDIAANINAERVYRDAIGFKKPGTEKTIFALFSYFQLQVFQFDEDIVEKTVTISMRNSSESFRVPEYKMQDQENMTAHLIEIFGYMPENTQTELRRKLSTLLSLLNESGIDKVLAYVEGLTGNAKYHTELDFTDMVK